MEARRARAEDAEAIARIYNEGIEDRVATFETGLRTAAEVSAFIDGAVVVEERGQVVAWAARSPYSARQCYAGVAEVSVYVARSERRRGAGRLALEALIDAAAAAGLHKLVGKVLADN